MSKDGIEFILNEGPSDQGSSDGKLPPPGS